MSSSSPIRENNSVAGHHSWGSELRWVECVGMDKGPITIYEHYMWHVRWLSISIWRYVVNIKMYAQFMGITKTWIDLLVLTPMWTLGQITRYGVTIPLIPNSIDIVSCMVASFVSCVAQINYTPYTLHDLHKYDQGLFKMLPRCKPRYIFGSCRQKSLDSIFSIKSLYLPNMPFPSNNNI